MNLIMTSAEWFSFLIRQWGIRQGAFLDGKQRYDGGITGDIIAIYMRYHEILVIIYVIMLM